jgi:hypothetical protein
MLENNPLKQYFRRPSIYFKLPSGGVYYTSNIVNIPPNGELPVYPMTAIDEMTIRTPDGLFNGAAVVELIKSCIPNIVDPWKLNNVDLDAVIVAIKAASGDGSMAIGSQCPSCNEQNEYEIDLLSILNKSVFIDYTDILKIRELEIKFRPLTYEETNKNSLNQFKIQKTLVTIDSYEDGEEKSKLMSDTIVQLTDLVTRMVANTIEHIQTPETLVTEKDYIVEFLNNCDRDTGSLIRNKSVELREKNELEPIDIKCPDCKHEYKQKIELNVTDFFD